MAIYIFENPKAKRVKVGVTGNNVLDRLKEVDREWGKITCQICGGLQWRNMQGYVTGHDWRGEPCPGGYTLPIEEDLKLAESYLKDLKNRISNLSGSEKGSMTRISNNIEKRIEKYQHNQPHNRTIGKWWVGIVYRVENIKGAGQVEPLSHKILNEYLDEIAPIGEVYCCSLSVASEAVESALSQLGLLQSTDKEDYSFYY
jgi:hypothetical protein